MVFGRNLEKNFGMKAGDGGIGLYFRSQTLSKKSSRRPTRPGRILYSLSHPHLTVPVEYVDVDISTLNTQSALIPSTILDLAYRLTSAPIEYVIAFDHNGTVAACNVGGTYQVSVPLVMYNHSFPYVLHNHPITPELMWSGMDILNLLRPNVGGIAILATPEGIRAWKIDRGWSREEHERTVSICKNNVVGEHLTFREYSRTINRMIHKAYVNAGYFREVRIIANEDHD